MKGQGFRSGFCEGIICIGISKDHVSVSDSVVVFFFFFFFFGGGGGVFEVYLHGTIKGQCFRKSGFNIKRDMDSPHVGLFFIFFFIGLLS